MKVGSPEKIQREHVAATSGDMLETQIARLREVFPEVIIEGKIDWEKLRITLGAAAESGPGRFLFSWAGRDDAVSLLQTPSSATLIACPEESINFESTSHAFIEGDNLEVLKLLFKPYFGRVKLIYIDPPYNTGQDFVYPDNYADPLKTYLQITGQVDAEGNLLTSNPETSGRYHSAWLSMMYPRLFLARQLLREDGVICISIDDHEVHHLRILMNEIFGEENFLVQAVWKKKYTGGKHSSGYVDLHEYILVYCKSREVLADLEIVRPDEEKEKFVEEDEFLEERGRFYVRPLKSNLGPRPTLVYPITAPDGSVLKTQWLVAPSTYEKLVKDKRVEFRQKRDGSYQLYRKYYEKDGGGNVKPPSLIEKYPNNEAKNELKDLFDISEGRENVFYTVKPVGLLRHLFEPYDDPDAIFLDFFAGSATTAQVILEKNKEDGGRRTFIAVQLPEPIAGDTRFASVAEIGKERIRRVFRNLYGDSKGQLPLNENAPMERPGFKVFKLARPNIQQWPTEEERDPDAYAQKILAFNDPLVSGWKPENVIWEVSLREGFSLNTRFSPTELPNGNKVYAVTDPDSGQQFWICLDEQIRADLIKQCELTQDRLFVCRDVALDDSAAANLALQCRLKTI